MTTQDDRWEHRWVVGLSDSPERALARVLLDREEMLSDGYGYYCNAEEFRGLMREAVSAVLVAAARSGARRGRDERLAADHLAGVGLVPRRVLPRGPGSHAAGGVGSSPVGPSHRKEGLAMKWCPHHHAGDRLEDCLDQLVRDVRELAARLDHLERRG